jgi:hypothetical protein
MSDDGNPRLDVHAMLERLREKHPDRLCDCGYTLRGRCPFCEQEGESE